MTRVLTLIAIFASALAVGGGAVLYHRLRDLGDRQRDALRIWELLDQVSERPSPREIDTLLASTEHLAPARLAESRGDYLAQKSESALRSWLQALRAECRRSIARSGRLTGALGQDLLQILALGLPLLSLLSVVALAWGVLRPIRQALQTESPEIAARAVRLWWKDLATLLEELDAQRRQRLVELLRAGQLAAIGTMAASVAHEIRNPLMAISGLAEGALERLPDECDTGVNERLQRLLRTAERVSAHLGRLQALSVDEEEETARFDLCYEIQEALQLVAARSPEVLESCRLRLPATFVIEGRVGAWRQLLFNLLVNAYESTQAAALRAQHDGGAATPALIEVSLEAGRLAIQDNGVGWDSAHGDRIFEAFVSDKGRGGGLGLFICEALMQREGVEVKAHSDGPGLGACFSLLIRDKGQS